MIPDMLNNKPIQIVTEWFIRGKKLDISLVFMTQILLGCAKRYSTKS